MNNLELYSCLRYTPFDNKITSIFDNVSGDDEVNMFYQSIFVKYKEKNLQLLIDELNSKIASKETRFINFIGAAGTGKTTFLHYYYRLVQERSENVSFGFVDLIKYPSESADEETFKQNLCCCIDAVSDKETVRRFLDCYLACQESISFLSGNNDIKLLNYLYLKKMDEKHSANNDLKTHYSIIQLITIYVILFIYKNNSIQHRLEQNVICFDNIDELSQVYIAQNVNVEILDVFSNVQEYFEKIGSQIFDNNYPFIDHCTFIISIRAINAKLLGENQAQNERMRFQNNNVIFDQRSFEYSKMLKSRINYFMTYPKTKLEDNKRLALRKYTQMVADEEGYVSSHIEPLLNFDRRMLSFSFGRVLEQYTWHDKIGNLPSGIGKRGAILLNTLDFLYNENNNSSLFSNYVSADISIEKNNKRQKCNIHRMCFTLLSNLSGLGSVSKENRMNVLNDETEFFEHLHSVPLDLFWKKLERWYSPEDIKNALMMLISTSSSNYEVPAFLEGSVVNQMTMDFYHNGRTKIRNLTYAQSLVDRIMNMTEIEKRSISIKINPLCVVYPYHVFIHFEYFNVVSYYDPNNKKGEHLSPLFLISDKNELRSCLNRVRGAFGNIIDSAGKHFCSFCNNESQEKCQKENCKKRLDDYKADQFCFNGALYSTRSITSFINYLDSYRVYKWKNEFDKEYQMILFEEIKYYIEIFWSKKVQDDAARQKIGEIKRQLRFVEEKGDYGSSIMPISDDFAVE